MIFDIEKHRYKKEIEELQKQNKFLHQEIKVRKQIHESNVYRISELLMRISVLEGKGEENVKKL